MSRIVFLSSQEPSLASADKTYAVSPSLGSVSRNYHFVLRVLGRVYHLCRIGVDNLSEMRQLLIKLDGKVGAFGIGGCDLGVRIGERIYRFQSVRRTCEVIRSTPYDDGYALKRILEPAAMRLVGEFYPDLRNCLIPVGTERWPLVSTAEQIGLNVRLGDLAFGLGISKTLSPKILERTAPALMGVVGRLPFHWLYPTGEKQKDRDPVKYKAMFDWAEVVAGDYHYIGRYAPDNLSKKVIVTNTTTKENRDFLSAAGVDAVITTTPQIAGRSPGTNALWALLATVIRDHGEEPTEENLVDLIRELEIAPEIHEP